MQPENIEHKPYELLGHMVRGASRQGLPSEDFTSDDQQSLQALTNAYITTLYYSALTNLCLQTILPKTYDKVQAENPRLEIAFNRSYADFIAAERWLSKNGQECIATSPAKQFYDEVQGMDKAIIMDTAAFYAQIEPGAKAAT